MTPQKYKLFKESITETFRDMLGDAIQDMMDYASDQLEQRNMIVLINEDDSDNDDDIEKVDQWVGHLIWSIVTSWGDNPEKDPFA